MGVRHTLRGIYQHHMSRRARLAPLVLGAAFLLSSCTHSALSELLVTRSSKEREIAALREEFAGRISALNAERDGLLKSVSAAKDGQMAGAGNLLFAADLAFKTIFAPTRTDLAINNYVNEAWVALGRPMPTWQQMQEIHQRVKDELDETKTSLEQLRANHARALEQNKALAETTRKYEASLAELEAKRLAAEREFAAKLDLKQTELAGVLAKLVAEEKSRADDRAALQAVKTKFSLVLGILALAAVAGTVYLPVYRRESAVFAGICAAASLGIWWIEPWMIGAAFGAILLVGLIVMALQHYRQEKLADSLVLSNQRIKELHPELWKTTVAPIVKDQLGTYRTTETSKTFVTPNRTMEKMIDEKLRDYERL